jgi:hypothetical protein
MVTDIGKDLEGVGHKIFPGVRLDSEASVHGLDDVILLSVIKNKLEHRIYHMS